MLLQWTRSAKRQQQFKGKGIKNGKVFSLMCPSQGESFLWRSFFTSQLIAELPKELEAMLYSAILQLRKLPRMIFSVDRREHQTGQWRWRWRILADFVSRQELNVTAINEFFLVLTDLERLNWWKISVITTSYTFYFEEYLAQKYLLPDLARIVGSCLTQDSISI